MIRTDSRKVKPGDVFVALPGFASNGDQYISNAIEAGAVKIICQKGQYEVETINTDDPRRYLEEMLAGEYGNIISRMTIIALTGTNGKTTTCYLISQALNRLGRKCGYIGTIGFYLDEKVRDLSNTSVDICELYELLLEAHEKGFDTVALEASSQGLDMGRLNTITFDIASFTNLTEDHLDYHKSMENYAMAKQKLFKALKHGGAALVNADDDSKKYFLLDENRNYTYGINSGDYRALEYTFDQGTDLTFLCNDAKYNVHTDMVGEHNVYNTMATIGVLNIMGYEPARICEAVEGLRAPDGRWDVIRYNECSIIIDYAHTPDAISNILKTAQKLASGRKYVVFGCTGDREKEKRPVMTQLVLSNCDYAIITDDDPHTEPEEQIVADMLEGNSLSNYEVCLDRKKAIQIGIDKLKPTDTLLILGKGHEHNIIMNGYSIPHNDRDAVLEYIQK